MTTPNTTVSSRTPRVDVLESDAAYLFVFDVPGATREVTEVALDNGTLLIRAEVGAPTDSEGRSHGESSRWERRVELPRTADESRIDAQLDAGVLRVTVARTMPSRKIAVA